MIYATPPNDHAPEAYLACGCMFAIPLLDILLLNHMVYGFLWRCGFRSKILDEESVSIASRTAADGLMRESKAHTRGMTGEQKDAVHEYYRGMFQRGIEGYIKEFEFNIYLKQIKATAVSKTTDPPRLSVDGDGCMDEVCVAASNHLLKALPDLSEISRLNAYDRLKDHVRTALLAYKHSAAKAALATATASENPTPEPDREAGAVCTVATDGPTEEGA